MRLYIGADHAGYQYKEKLKDFLQAEGHDPVDLGTFNEDSIDYPDIAREVAEKVYENKESLGILICGSGTGVCMAANKHVGIRAASCANEWLAEHARKHNDANILCLGSRVIGDELARDITRVFLATEFDGGRHQIRVDKISALEGGTPIHGEKRHEDVVPHKKDL
jgi:ribose 5-phosphate isomerase B